MALVSVTQYSILLKDKWFKIRIYMNECAMPNGFSNCLEPGKEQNWWIRDKGGPGKKNVGGHVRMDTK